MAQYDRIARPYHESIETLPYMPYACDWTVLAAIGELGGRSVLDFGCGEGYFSRQLKRLGAGRAIGFDISEGMVKLAQSEERRQPLGIRYLVADAANLPLSGGFDLAVAKFVLNYARSYAEMAEMARGAFRVLKPGGRFLCVLPDFSRRLASDPKYGFTVEAAQPLHEGDSVAVSLWHADGRQACPPFRARYWHPATYGRSLREAGFATRWHPLRISPEGTARYGAAFWQDLLDTPTLCVLEGTRP